MVDFVTQTRHYGYRYSAPTHTDAVSTNRDIYRQNAPKLFKTGQVKVHDCRESVMKKFSDPGEWEAWLLTSGLHDSLEGTASLHHKQNKEEEEESNKKPDKLLYDVGEKGHHKEQFVFPRSISACENGDILIADSGNHRIQLYNQCGVHIRDFGEKGSGPGQFREPTGVTQLSNGAVVVADRRNKRIQVLSDQGEFKYEFKTVDDPFYVRSDAVNNIIVSTTTGWIEVYRRPANLWYRFKIPEMQVRNSKVKMAACSIAVNNKDEVLVSNIANRKLQFYTYSGKLVYQFEPESTVKGLACQPSGVSFNPMGQIVMADTLNHMVNVYSERGALQCQLVSPSDGAGAMQDIAVGAEGHLVASEYTTNGPHCLKIFRYMPCECHRTRPGSAKKSQPSTEQ